MNAEILRQSLKGIRPTDDTADIRRTLKRVRKLLLTGKPKRSIVKMLDKHLRQGDAR